ncbi:MAG: hypothetical protein ACREQV_14660, partial [Candidatus Binatia bacterium]
HCRRSVRSSQPMEMFIQQVAGSVGVGVPSALADQRAVVGCRVGRDCRVFRAVDQAGQEAGMDAA